jgi:hypothetical protein
MVYSLPIYKITVYHGANLIHTITSDALNIHTKEILTDNVGVFSFVVPNGPNYRYNDIAVYDTVYVWFGYRDRGDTLTGTADYRGRITQISGPMAAESGMQRAFTGVSTGEVLKRRINSSRYWVNTHADLIVDDIADDLGLGVGSIDDCDIHETIHAAAETYLDTLQRASDYYDAGGSVKKDFYVDVDNNLVWKARPIRTQNVETLTVGDNIIRYDVLRDIESVKNSIKVYGAAGVYLPSDRDEWTEDSTDGWSCKWGTAAGAVATDAVVYRIADKSIKLTMPGAWVGDAIPHLTKTFSATEILTTGGHKRLHFYLRSEDFAMSYSEIRLLAPDSSNYYSIQGYGDWVAVDTWTPEQIVDLAKIYSLVGSPEIDNIQGVDIVPSAVGAGYIYNIDGMYLEGARYVGTATNAASKTDYGQRDLQVTDDALLDNATCTARAETLLYQMKDPPIRVDITTVGNNNIKIGDRLTLTIPAEAITAQPYDVIAVEHNLSPTQGFITQATTINTSDNRTVPALNVSEVINKKLSAYRQVARGMQVI